MPWSIEIGGLLKGRQLIRRVTELWLLLVVVGSMQPTRLLMAAKSVRVGKPVPAASWHTGSPVPAFEFHREIHWLAFGGAAFLLLLLSRNRRGEIQGALALGLLGLSLEYLQHLIYHVPMEWFDVRDDALAILVTLALYQLACTGTAAFRAWRSA